MMKRCLVFFCMGLVVLAGSASAELQREMVEYRDGETVLEGYLVYDDRFEAPTPGVMVVHEWTGPGPYERGRADQLAMNGYSAFVADIYGKGVRPSGREDAARQAAVYRSDRTLMRSRASAGIAAMKRHPRVDPDKVSAIGYCFGGGVVLELARSGEEIRGVASFHGDMEIPNPDDIRNIKAAVLVLHGADDPYIPREQFMNFWDQMSKAQVYWQINIYSGAVHSFTNPGSGDDPSDGAAYNAKADQMSWEALMVFFERIFWDQGGIRSNAGSNISELR